MLPQLRYIGQRAEALFYAAPAREQLTIPVGLFTHPGPSHGRRAKRHQVRGVHGNAPRILSHNVKLGRDCGHLDVVDTILRLLYPGWMEGHSVVTSTELLSERLGIVLPTPEDATNVAHLVSRNCGAHHVKPWSLVGPRAARTCNQSKRDRAAR